MTNPPTTAAASAEMAKKSTGALRLRYKVIYVTSEDESHPASELMVAETNGFGMTSGQGWMSRKFPSFPQMVILELDRRSSVKQMQFLSHQSAISTKLELYTSVEGPRTPYDPVKDPDGVSFVNSIPFKRLGYLSLDSNEKSQWLARELKSVFVDCTARFVQVKLHKCHVNKLNLHSQVGLIAINILGDYLDPPTECDIPPMIAIPIGTVNDASGDEPNSWLHQSPGGGDGGGGLGFNAQRHLTVDVAGGDGSIFNEPLYTGDFSPLMGGYPTEDADPETQKQINQLTMLKQRAVEVEDYDEAMRLKDEIARLQGVSRALAELERSKRQAVEEEDYPRAKALKEEIHRLRTNGAGIAAKPQQPSRQSQTAYEQRYQYYQSPVTGMSARSIGLVVGGSASHKMVQGSIPPGDVFTQRSSSGDTVNNYPSSRGGINAFDEVPAVAGSNVAAAAAPSSKYDHHHHHHHQRSILEAGPNSIPSEYLGQDPYYAAKVAGGSVTPGEPTPKTPPLEGDRGPHPDLPNVPNSEALPTAEILPPAVAHEAQGAPMALLGEYIIRCIVSKDWRVREAGFIQAEHDLDHGVWADKGGDAASGSHAAIYAVRKCVTDKIANVFLPCMRLLQAAASSVFNEMCSSMPRGARELHTLLEPLMPSLADRLSDPNKRCQEASKNAIVAIAVNVGPSFATHHVMKISSRRALGSRGTSTAASSLLPNRALSARCEVLQLVLDTCGLMASEGSSSSEGNSHGGGFTAIPLLTMAFDLIKQCPASEVRAAAISLAAKVCSLVGPEAIRPFIKGIERQSQREAIEAEIDRVVHGRVGGGKNSRTSLGRRPQSGESNGKDYQPSRPSVRDHINVEDDGNAEGGGEGAVTSCCQFCGYSDPSFIINSDALDVHYWRDCPSLTQCYSCGQVVELAGLAEHRAVECEEEKT